MTRDLLGPVRFVGRRLRVWRAEHNWSGQDTATKVSAPGFDWPALRFFEVGEALPDVTVATQLAEIFGHRLSDLLASDDVARLPLGQQELSVHELPQIRRILDEHSLDVDLAQQFFEVGQSAALVQSWLRSFSVEDAITLARSGMGPIEAGDWMESGRSAEHAALLKRSGFKASDLDGLAPDGVDRAGELPLEVLVLRLRLGLSPTEKVVYPGLEHWDLLSTITWELAGFNTTQAGAWAVQGFTALQAVELRDTFDPEMAGEWRASGIDATEWPRWTASGFAAVDAKSYAEAGISYEEASRWRDAKFAPREAASFHSSHFDVDAAESWREAHVPLPEAKRWKGQGLSPKDREHWIAVTADPEIAKPWIKMGVPLNDAKGWIKGGVHPKKVGEWTTQGFDARAATLWKGTSPERARRLAARGVTPDQDWARRMRGAERVEAARTAIAQGLTPQRANELEQARQHTDVKHVPAKHATRGGPVVKVCKACGGPVGVNALCGCS